MKLLKLALAAMMSFTVINAAVAAEHTEDTSGKQKIGVISVDGAYSLDGLADKLSDKADEEGASSFKIISTTGNNKMHGVAEIYK